MSTILVEACRCCGNPFHREVGEVNRGKATFCSPDCTYRFRRENANPTRMLDKYRRWHIRTGEVAEMWARSAIHGVRARAKKKGIECSIIPADLLPLPEICPLLGIALVYTKGRGQIGFLPDAPSLDRIDNTKGYIPGNVWIISYRANSIKRDATLEELQTLAACLSTAMKVIQAGKRFQ